MLLSDLLPNTFTPFPFVWDVGILQVLLCFHSNKAKEQMSSGCKSCSILNCYCCKNTSSHQVIHAFLYNLYKWVCLWRLRVLLNKVIWFLNVVLPFTSWFCDENYYWHLRTQFYDCDQNEMQVNKIDIIHHEILQKKQYKEANLPWAEM